MAKPARSCGWCNSPGHRKSDQRQQGQRRPAEETTSTGLSSVLAGFDRANFDLLTIYYYLDEKAAKCLELHRQVENGPTEDGKESLQELVGKYFQIIDEIFPETIGSVVNTCRKQGQNTDVTFLEEPLAPSEDKTMSKTISDCMFQRLGHFTRLRGYLNCDSTLDIEQI